MGVYDKYVAVRAARTYETASQFCSDWHGSTLATIVSDEDNVSAMEACQSIDIQKRSCWIGLQRPFKRWDDQTESEIFTNWAPHEPNNAGYSENCAEMYGGNGKWNDLGCSAKRFFLCNAQTTLQRMDTKKRKRMILKRLRRHRDVWKRYRRAEYRKKIRRQYRKKMVARIRRQKMMQRQMMQRRRQALRQRVFRQQYGGFMKGGNIQSFRQFDSHGGFGGTTAIYGGMKKMNEGFRRRRMSEMEMFDDEQYDDEYDEEEEYDENEDYDDIDVKCTFFNGLNGFGFYEMCIDGKGVDIKRYIKKEETVYNDAYEWNGSLVLNDSYLNYMEYEELKYKLAMKHDDKALYVIDNEMMNDQIGSYRLLLTQFVYDLFDNDKIQCQQYTNHFELCMELNEDDNNMMIEIIKAYQENLVIYAKCIHIFGAKLCIECKSETNGENESNPVPLSFIANVLIDAL